MISNIIGKIISSCGVLPPSLGKLSGTQFFMLDSLTAGVTSGASITIDPATYTVTKLAHEEGRLRKFWVKMSGELTPASRTTLVAFGSGVSTTLTSTKSPNQKAVIFDGANLEDKATISFGEFGWSTARVYFVKQAGGGSIKVSSPVVSPSLSTSGVDGEIVFIDITNPTPGGLTDIVIDGATGPVELCGLLCDTGINEDDYLDVVSFSFSGDLAKNYNLVTNIGDWYLALGISGAIVNAGTNDVTYDGYASALSAVNSTISKLCESLDSSNVTVLMPIENQPTTKGQNLWDKVAKDNNTQFVALSRLYGGFDKMSAEGYMNDSIHPNTLFNSTRLGPNEYSNNLIKQQDSLEIGVEPHLIYECGSVNGSIAKAPLDSNIVLSGDYTIEARHYLDYSGGTTAILGTITDTNSYMYIHSTGVVRVKVGGLTLSDPAATVLEDKKWYTTILTATPDGFVVTMNGDVVFSATSASHGRSFTIESFLESWGVPARRGKFAWFIVTESSIKTHQWLFNQEVSDLVILDSIGSVNALWVGKRTGSSAGEAEYAIYSIKSNGEFINYYTLNYSGEVWGDVSWPL